MLIGDTQTEVGVNAWGLSYNKDLYGADVHEYRPERWFERSIGTTTSSISQFAVSGKFAMLVRLSCIWLTSSSLLIISSEGDLEHASAKTSACWK